jgi:hypothetical protein
MDEALCVECQQNKADFLEKIVVRIVSPFQTRGNRVLFASGPDLATSLQRAIKAIQNLPAAAQAAEILIRIQAPLREIGS